MKLPQHDRRWDIVEIETVTDGCQSILVAALG